MSNLETYREKALKCARAADEVHDTAERAELLGLAAVYRVLADYVDGRHEHGPARRGDQHQDTQRTVRYASSGSRSKRAGVTHLEFGLIVFLALAATQFFIWLAIRGPALLERSSSWQATCFLVSCETQAQPHREAQARPEAKSQARLERKSEPQSGPQPQSQALLQPQAQPRVQARPQPPRHPPPARPHTLDGVVAGEPRRSPIECWRDRSIRGPCFE